ncbi:MAG: hypothetical protein ACO1NY_15585, partial [Pseudorhodoplanes sp.]
MPLSSDIRPEPNPPLDRARVIRAREMYAEGFTVSRLVLAAGEATAASTSDNPEVVFVQRGR